MKTNTYIKTSLFSLAVYAGIAIASVNTFSMAHATDYTAHKTMASQTAQIAVDTAPYSQLEILPLYEQDYMKTSYRDFKVRLVGPFNITLDDDHIQQRFKNLNSLRAQRIRSPYETSTYTAPTYYTSTIAKTGFKLKF